MGYQVPKHNNRRGWKVLHVSYKDGLRIYRGVPEHEFAQLGLRPDMSREEAMQALGPKNAQAELARHEARRNRVADRMKADRLTLGSFLPANLLTEFEQTKLDMEKPKLRSYWKRACEVMAEVRLEPKDWDDNVKAFYAAFTRRKMSPNYVRQVLPLLNAWGKWWAKRHSSYFVPLPSMRGRWHAEVAEAYFSKTTHTAGNKESAPLTPEKLESKRSELKPEHYRWLALSVWFGLRPIEVDLLSKPTSKRTWWVTKEQGKRVLWVYQTKLKGVAPEKRIKYIPALTPEQELALSYLEQPLKRPMQKTMGRVFGGEVTLYGGRKGFVDLMKAYGQSFENVSAWLGHATVVRTYQSYYNRHKVKWDDVA